MRPAKKGRPVELYPGCWRGNCHFPHGEDRKDDNMHGAQSPLLAPITIDFSHHCCAIAKKYFSASAQGLPSIPLYACSAECTTTVLHLLFFLALMLSETAAGVLRRIPALLCIRQYACILLLVCAMCAFAHGAMIGDWCHRRRLAIRGRIENAVQRQNTC